MRIEHLQFLVEIAKCRSISTAAKKLYISQTGLSAIVNSIEAELNIQIFRRTNKGTVLTPEGEESMEIIQDILQKNDELHFLHSSNSHQRRIINLGVFPSGTYALSSHLTKIWARQHKHTHLHIYEIGHEDLYNCINNHIASIVIGAESPDFFNAIINSSNGRTFAEPLFQDHFHVLVSSRSALADNKFVHLDNILDYHLLLTHTYPNPQDKPIGHILHKFKNFSVLNNLEVAKNVLSENPDMLMLVPSFAVYQDRLTSGGQLKLLDITGFDTALTIFMMYDSSARLNIQEMQLMQEIRNFFVRLA